MIFHPLDLRLSDLAIDPECKEYYGHHFKLNDVDIKFRTAKITPTKTGQFVTIWKRNEKRVTVPFDQNDPFEFYLIATQKENILGLFIFPKSVLLEKGVLSNGIKAGKRGIRVYPSWDTVESKQAITTQKWQTKYFLEFSSNKEHDLQRAKLLLTL